jgi:hypothetical protein
MKYSTYEKFCPNPAAAKQNIEMINMIFFIICGLYIYVSLGVVCVVSWQLAVGSSQSAVSSRKKAE